jgi:glutaminyl-tRNA synthetase
MDRCYIPPMTEENTGSSNFIETIIAEHDTSGKFDGRVHTRFPPEPNGFLHIGHAKAICINFGIAQRHDGQCNLRFDDTNPVKEDTTYVDAIKQDIQWLGWNWDDREFFASDYFEQLYSWAVQLIRDGHAYVDDLSADEIREHRGTLTEPGTNSPYRDRTPEENLDLFERMRAGEYPDGAKVLRAKIDMTSGNINLRDPVMYRILRASHHRTGDAWCIYPTYDFTHGQSDSIEGITHSLCSLEFEDHRPLYNWYVERLGIHHPQQIEFARLNMTHTVMSKRKLKKLVDDGIVTGWDDPRMPTLAGMRRRGFPPGAIRAFCEMIGVSKQASLVPYAMLEYCVRQELNKTSPRVMGVLNPLKVVIENYPEDLVEELDAINNPEDESAGTRKVPFSREFYIEREDFREDPPRKYFRLGPGREVRLRYGYFVTCTGFTKNDDGEVVEVRCTYDPETRGGNSPDGRKVKGTIHWVSAARAVPATVRLYDHLFTPEDPAEIESADSLPDVLDPESEVVLDGAFIEPSLLGAEPGHRVQFERRGYFVVDRESSPERLVFNRTATLRDTWAKIEKKLNG